MPQERAANNTAFVFPKYTNNKSILECEIRSSLDDSPSSANAFWVSLQSEKIVRMSVTGSDLAGSMSRPVLKVKFPGLKELLDISVLYQALGFESVNEIVDSILIKTAVEDPMGNPHQSLKQSQIQVAEIVHYSFSSWRSRSCSEARICIGKYALIFPEQRTKVN
jgi:hypothetical protein